MINIPLLTLTRRQRYKALLSIAVACVQAAAFLPITLSVKAIFDLALVHKDSAALLRYAGTIIVLYLFAHALEIWNRAHVLTLTKQLVAEMRLRLMGLLLSLPRERFMALNIGASQSILVNDSERIDMLLNSVISKVLPAIIISVLMLGACFSFSPVLSLLVVASCGLHLLYAAILRPRIKARVENFHSAFSRFSEQTTILLRAFDLLNAHEGKRRELDNFSLRVDALNVSSRTMMFLQGVYTLGQHSLAAVTVSAVLVVGGLGVIRGDLLIGDLAGFYAGLVLLRGSFGTIVDQSPTLAVGMKAREQVRKLAALEISPVYQGTRSVGLRRTLQARELSFSYAAEPVIKNLSFNANAGEVTALTGPNGSGKTTLLQLVLGFYRPDSGSLFVDDTSYEQIDIAQWRKSVAYVPQNPLLIPGSIRSNLLFGNGEVSEETLREMCLLTGIDEVIGRLSGGWDAVVGDDGMTLSGGQRQLIAITRACLRSPKLFLLDEPTIHLDTAVVHRVLNGILRRFKNSLILVSTHDQEVIGIADRLVHVGENSQCKVSSVG